MSGKVPAALSGTKGGEDVVRGLAEMQSKILEKANESLGGSTKEFSTKLSKSVDDVGAAFRKLIKGEGSVDELMDAFKKASSNLKSATTSEIPGVEMPDFTGMFESLADIAMFFKSVTTGNDIVISKTGVVNEKKESKFTVDQNVNLKISIDAPPQIDTSMIEKVLKDRGVTEQIIANIKNVKSNSNLTPSLV
jgi:flagellar hook-basal body complex protein FliE